MPWGVVGRVLLLAVGGIIKAVMASGEYERKGVSFLVEVLLSVALRVDVCFLSVGVAEEKKTRTKKRTNKQKNTQNKQTNTKNT